MRRTGLRAAALAAALLMTASGCRGTGDSGGRAGDVETGLGVQGRTIRLGELSPFTGPVAVIGNPLTEGHRVYFKYVNEQLGGVGRDLPKDERFRVELVERDTQYLNDVQVQQYNAIKDEVLMVAQSLGTPTTKAILPQIREDEMLTGAATLSVEWLREKYVVPAGAPYPVQFINAASYVVREQGRTPKTGIIYQDDDYGQEGIKGAEFAAESFNFPIVARAAYKTGDTDFTAQVTAMRNAGADHVFLTAVPSAAGKILGTAATLGYSPQWIGQSPTWIGTFATSPNAPYLQQHFWLVTDASCEWGQTGPECRGMEEMIENLKRYAPNQPPDNYFQFGYTQARIVHQILEKAVADGELTREGLLKAFESLRNVDMGGLLNPISYGPRCRDKIPATGSSIFTVDPGAPTGLKLLKKVDSPAVKEFPFCD